MKILPSKARKRVGSWLWVAAAVIAALVVWLIQREQVAVDEARRQNAALVSAFAQSGTAVVELDEEGTIIGGTPAFYTLTGYSEEDLLGQPVESLMPKPYRERHRLGFEAVLGDGAPLNRQILCHIQRQDGTITTVINHVFSHADGGIAIVVPVSLEVMETRLALMGMEAANVGAWWWEIDEDVLVWDARMRRIYGFDESEQTLDYKAFSDLVHPDDRGWLDELVATCVREDKAYRAVFRVIRPDGALVHVRAYGRMFPHEFGTRKLVGVNIIIQEDEYTGGYELID